MGHILCVRKVSQADPQHASNSIISNVQHLSFHRIVVGWVGPYYFLSADNLAPRNLNRICDCIAVVSLSADECRLGPGRVSNGAHFVVWRAHVSLTDCFV